MPRAVLQIHVEGAAEAARAFGQIRAAARTTNAGILADERRSGETRRRIASDTSRAQIAEERKAARETQKAASDKARFDKMFAQERERATIKLQNAMTAAAEKEGRRRVSIELKVQREITQIQERQLRDRMHREQAASAQAARQAQQDTRRQEGRVWRYGWAAAGAIRQGAGAMHSEVQGADRRRAASEVTINAALLQTAAGQRTPLSVEEVTSNRARVYGFARQHGLRSADLAQGLERSQTYFASLQRQDPTSRREALEGMLENMRIGRVMHQDMGEVAMYSGMMAARGLSPEMITDVVRRSTAIAFQGNVSLGDIARQARGPVMEQYMTRLASARGASPQERQQIVRDATLDMFTKLQFEAAAGGRPGISAAQLNLAERQLGNNATSNMLYHRLTRQFRGNAAAQTQIEGMFQVDPSSRMRTLSTEQRNPLAMARNLYGLFGGDPTAVRNFLGARGVDPTGHRWEDKAGGRRQILRENAVTSMMRLFDTDTEGRTVFQRFQPLANVNIDDQYMDVMRRVTEGEQETRLAREEETHDSILTDNTNAVTRLSRSFDTFAAQHPFMGPAVQAGTGFATTVVAAELAGRGYRLAAPAVAATMAGAGGGGAGVVGTAGRVLTGAARWLGVGASFVQTLLSTHSDEYAQHQANWETEQVRRARRGLSHGQQEAGGSLEEALQRRAFGAAQPHGAAGSLMGTSAQPIVVVFAPGTTLPATVTPQAVQQVLHASSTGPQATPPEHRR